MYSHASASYESSLQETEAESLYRTILDKQIEYSVNLANNAAFREWVVEDWPNRELTTEGQTLPPFSDSFVSKFGSDEFVAEEISTFDLMESAMYTLYYYREEAGLEFPPPMYRRRRELDVPYSDRSFWSSCS